jgi:hypothetical protein
VSPSNPAQQQSLRLKYNAAYTAHRSCAEALGNANIDGKTPSAERLQKEANALRELTEREPVGRDAR